MAHRMLLLVLAVVGLALATAEDTQPCKEFNLQLTWGQHNPVGKSSRDMFLINGQTPGPLIEADQDDWVVVRVDNQTPFNVTIHFHGIEMLHTPWSDGVPGVTQRAIEPSDYFVHKFRASQYGSYWYHAHYRGQIDDGLLGPMIIHPRKGNPTPFHLISSDPEAVRAMKAAERQARPLFISDWSHVGTDERWDVTLDTRIEMTCYDAVTINGKGRIECLSEDEIKSHIGLDQQALLDNVPGSGFTDKGCMEPEPLSHLADPGAAKNIPSIPESIYYGCEPTEGEIEVIRPPKGLPSGERWVAIDIIAATSFIRAAVSIDDHDMYVYAMDGSYIEPQKVQAVPFSNGDRYSVLVKIDKPGSFQIRVRSTTLAQMITAHAILLVDGPEDAPPASQTTAEPNVHINVVGKPTSPEVRFFNESRAPPFPAMPIPESADVLHHVSMFQDGATYLWALNNSRLMPEDFEDVETPVLLNPDPQARENVTLTTQNGQWVDLVFTLKPKPRLAHPIHKHGNKMFVLGSGTGPFKWDSVDEAVRANPQAFNLANPPQRDTVLTPMPQPDGAWQVVRYQVTNPGVWLLHCHINNHMLGGMSMVIQDGIDALPEIPSEYQS